jgi:hypothetical protein
LSILVENALKGAWFAVTPTNIPETWIQLYYLRCIRKPQVGSSYGCAGKQNWMMVDACVKIYYFYEQIERQKRTIQLVGIVFETSFN